MRNWPSPKIVWQAIFNKAEEIFNKTSFTVIIGGDCSIEVGTFSAFKKIFGEKAHLLVLEGYIDTIEPRGDRCVGAAGMGLWFLTQEKTMWCGEKSTSPSSISVIGTQC